MVPNGELIVHRARSDRTIQFLGQYGVARQSTRMPLEVSALVAVEGTDNFRDQYSPTAGIILTRLFGERGAMHIEPLMVANSNLSELSNDDDSTFMIGLGGRLRVTLSVYVVGEVTPRIRGYKPEANLGSFAVE